MTEKTQGTAAAAGSTRTQKLRGRIIINEHFCKGCSLCVDACPQHIIGISAEVSDGGYYPAICHDLQGKCTGCTLCAVVCPDVAIEVFKTAAGEGGSN